MSLENKLQDLIRRREALQLEQQRLQAQLEVSTKGMETLEAELASKGVDPAALDEFIEKLRGRYDNLLASYASQLTEAEGRLKSIGGIHAL